MKWTLKMIDSLPQDQAALIVERLGEARVARISEQVDNVSSFYKLCIREMGSTSGNGKVVRIPNKTNAWLEVISHKKDKEEPEWSHPVIERTVASFGGWTNMIEEFRQTTIPKAKGRFQYAYEDVIGG